MSPPSCLPPYEGERPENMANDLKHGVAVAGGAPPEGVPTSHSPIQPLVTTVIEPTRGWVPLKASELW